jgi:hypothetical protein
VTLEHNAMTGTVAKKLGVKEGTRAIFVDAPDLDLATELSGEFDYIHFFVKSGEVFNETFPKLKVHLSPRGMLWVSWHKNRQLGYNFGLVESKIISINATWSAIKFTHPKPGKAYQNSYGKLKSTDK